MSNRRIMTCIMLELLLVFALATFPSLPASTASSDDALSDDWAMFRHDPSHTGYSTSTGPDINATLWVQTVGWGGTELMSPAVAYGRLYVGDNQNRINCLNASIGSYIWNYTTGNYLFNCPAISDGKVYVGSLDGTLYCLDAYTGHSIWNYTIGQAIESSPAVSDGKIYFGSRDRNVYCLNAVTGLKIWNYSTGRAVDSSPAVADGKVYVASYDKNLYCLNALTGSKIWNYTVGEETDSSPTVAGGNVYCAAYNGMVYCLNAVTGAKVWNCSTHDYHDWSPAFADGMVFLGSELGRVFCFNASTGRIVWITSFHKSNLFQDSSPAVLDGKVYIVSDESLYCLKESTGSQIWSYDTGTGMYPSPVAANGIVYVGPGYDGKVYAFQSELIDGFESDDFTSWTGTVFTSGETGSIVTTTAYQGTHAARFTSNGGGAYENAFCYKTLTANSLYARGYFNVSQSGINSDNDRFFFIIFRNGSDGLAYAGWKRVNGTVKWCITMRNGTSYVDVFSDSAEPYDWTMVLCRTLLEKRRVKW